MTIYLDVIFLLNFAIDYMLLWITAFINKRQVRWHRLALGSLIGALYTLVLFFPPLSQLYTFAVKLLFSLLMMLAVFGFHGIRSLGKLVFTFYLVTVFIGGGLLAVFYLLQSNSQIISNMAKSNRIGIPVPTLLVFIGFPVMWWLTKKSYQSLKTSKWKDQLYGKVEIWLDGNWIECQGLVDTGNQLHEPISRTPVMVINSSLLIPYLPDPLKQMVREEGDLMEKQELLNGLGDQWLSRVRFIPYRSVAKGMDLLLALKPDKVIIHREEMVYIPPRVLIGLNPLPLSSEGTYQAIVHPGLLSEDAVAKQKEAI